MTMICESSAVDRLSDSQRKYRALKLDFPRIADRLLAATHCQIPMLEEEKRGICRSIENCGCAMARQFQQHALDDDLTGLPNRRLFSDCVCRQLHSHQTCAVLVLNVDGFRSVNNGLERDAGDTPLGSRLRDRLLATLARRLQRCVDAGDLLARVGRDEFAILLESSAAAGRVADRIQAMLSFPIELHDRDIFISVSMGIASTTPENENAEDLLRNANLAMYRAKKLGRERATVFEPTLHDRLLKRWQLENDLRGAVEELFSDRLPQFQLSYQPIVSLANDRIVGFEALLRWFHPQRGLVSPAEFIPIAEETGAIVPIGRWVLQTAGDRLAQWQTEFDCPDLTMSVNVSLRQFRESDFAGQVVQVLESTAIAPDCLKLEITESLPLDGSRTLFAQLKRLRRLGVRLSLDDFGTGYSSLSHLHRLPVDTLKIDRSFVSDLGTPDRPQERVLRAIVALGLGLDLEIVAEGVETPQQRDRLKAMGCQFGQGYLFSQPLPADRIAELLSNSR